MSCLELRRLRSTDLDISELCLGAVTFGNQADTTTSADIIDRFLDAGGNFIDTADVYANGLSEEIIGRVLVGCRERVILSTKGGMQTETTCKVGGASRRSIIEAVEASLHRLKTEWIDLYQIHVPDPRTPQEETIAALDELVRSGKIRYVGVSNYAGWQLAKALGISTISGLVRFVSLQAQYSLVSRDIEFDLVPLCQEENLAIIAYAPLGGGILSGKYDSLMPPGSGTRLADSPMTAHPLTKRNMAIAEELRRIAKELGRSPAQVALRWITDSSAVVSSIVGVRKLSQLDDNLGIAGWSLDEESVRSLDAVSKPHLMYPHNLQRMLNCQPGSKLQI